MNAPPVNLIARLSTLMQKYDEVIKLTDAQNPEFDVIWELEVWMRRQLYIITADEYGLRRFERLLNIRVLPDDTLEMRRNRVLIRWNMRNLYTFRFLISLLEALTGGEYEIIPNFEYYEMEILVFRADPKIMQELAYIKRHVIPANIGVTSRNVIPVRAEGKIVIGGIKQQTKRYIISQVFNAEIKPDWGFGVHVAPVKVTHHTIREDD